jgi:hypothetical protein
MTNTQAVIGNKGEPVEPLNGIEEETSGAHLRGLTKSEIEVKPRVVGLAHSSEEVLETEWSKGAGQFKC